MNPDVPDTVACPCGNGYADRYQRPIRERVTRIGTAERQVRLTFVYRHEGCPIGGHVVVQNAQVTRRAGPLFADEPNVERLQTFASGGTLAADGGEPG